MKRFLQDAIEFLDLVEPCASYAHPYPGTVRPSSERFFISAPVGTPCSSKLWSGERLCVRSYDLCSSEPSILRSGMVALFYASWVYGARCESRGRPSKSERRRDPSAGLAVSWVMASTRPFPDLTSSDLPTCFKFTAC